MAIEEIYNISVTDNTTVSSPWSNSNITWGQWDYPLTTAGNTSYWYGATVYLYQITCPRCKTQNWAEVDKIVDCKGKLGKRNCLAKLKAVKEVVDYEIPVG